MFPAMSLFEVQGEYAVKNHKEVRFLQYRPGAVRMLLVVLVLPLVLASHVQLAWGAWPADGSLVSQALYYDGNIQLVSDNEGGAFAMWEWSSTVRAQRIDRFGDLSWSSEFATPYIFSQNPDLAADGNGGAFLAWDQDARVYAQHLTADGTPLWNGDPGVMVSGGHGPRIITNEGGDPFIGWGISGYGNPPTWYMQRLGAAGEGMWPANLYIGSDATGFSMVPDGNDGVLTSYVNYSFPDTDRRIRGERVDRSGNTLWGDITISNANGLGTSIVSDGHGGAISAAIISDFDELRLFRTDGDGINQWSMYGIDPFEWQYVRTYGGYSVKVISDREGGAIVAMVTANPGYDEGNILINRVLMDGSIAWETSGIVVNTTLGGGFNLRMAPDGFGGAYIVWEDGRNYDSTGYDIYAQHFDADGVPQWATGGVPICTAPYDQLGPRITRTGSHDAIVAWHDFRNGTNNSPDLYAQKLNYDGTIGNSGLSAITFVPPLNAIDVSPTTNIKVGFNGTMDPNTMNANTITVHGSIGGIYDMTHSMPWDQYSLLMEHRTIIPPGGGRPSTRYFEAGEVVTVMLTDSVVGDGETLPPTSWSFTVASTNANGLFPTSVEMPAENTPTALHAADINRDGDTDLLVVNAVSNTLTRFRGNGDGSFSTGVDFATGASPVALLAVDFDLDGDLDVAVANRDDNTLSIFGGVGDAGGRLLDPVTYATGTNPQWMCSGDFDGDGYLDLATSNKISDNFSLLLNDQVGGFLPAVNYAAGNGTNRIACADLNNDGHLDIVCTNILSNEASIFLNLGSGVFADATHISGIIYPRSVHCADVDSDGDIDVVIAVTNAILLLRNRGDATFKDPEAFYGGLKAQSTRPTDIDGDGRLDLVASDVATDKVMVAINDGAGGFYTPTIFDTGNGPDHLVTADFDNDGELDIATANYYGDDVSVLLNGAIESATPEMPTIASTQLLANVPNPFNPRTKIEYSVAQLGHVRLAIYDMRGALVNMLVDGPQEAGNRFAMWDGRDQGGDLMPSGVYFYRLNTAKIALTRRMTLLK